MHKKQGLYIHRPQKTHFRYKDTHRLTARGWKKVFHASGNTKKAEVAILISDKIDFKTKTATRDKDEHYILIKESLKQEDITIVIIYSLNKGTPKYIKLILRNIKGEVNSNIIIVGDPTYMNE